MVFKERERETNAMMSEEYLNHYDNMRTSRDTLQDLYQSTSTLATQRDESIKQILYEHAEQEKRRTEGMIEFGTQTVIGANYFNKKPGNIGEMGSSRGSASMQNSQQSRGLQGKGRGAGRGANRPPPGGSKQSSGGGNSPSKAGRPGVDTTSSKAPSN